MIGALASLLAGPIGRAIAGGLVAVVLGIAAAEAWEHKAPWGLGRRLEAARGEAQRWHGASDRWSRAALGWRASFLASEGLRGEERRQAVAAVSAEARACAARVAEARRAALAIHALVNKEPRYDADHCPVRSLLDPDRLRDALGAR